MKKYTDEKTYGDLNLRKIREEAKLDFAHFTFLPGQCSCCYGPPDLPLIYWSGKTMAEKRKKRTEADKNGDYSYILFKNAYNGSGSVRKKDIIGRYDLYYRSEYGSVYVSWQLSQEQLDLVCSLLQEQLGAGYKVTKPQSDLHCIKIEYVGEGVTKQTN